jgi:hypothetical protein
VLGYPDQAAEAAEDAIRHAHKLDHPFNLSFTFAIGSGAYVYAKKQTEIRKCYSRSVNIADEQALPMLSNWAAVIYAGGEVILEDEGR